MNHRIFESIVTTENEDGSVQIAPMGIWEESGQTVLAPFKPSRTLDNISRSHTAVVNFTDDVRIFAGCLTGRYAWPVSPAHRVSGFVLDAALSHIELKNVRVQADDIRPRFYCDTVYQQQHGDFKGFNRAQAAVLELAILVSRLDWLSSEKIEAEIAYLKIAIDKTAGPTEREAWEWLMNRVNSP
ncbi:MAG: DUF447 family protein [Gammaproteobacteria bacterium]|nr:DUF447 family protein [Gammaproteobacteria bacterium]